jgi:hypothetical protein
MKTAQPAWPITQLRRLRLPYKLSERQMRQ